MGCLLPFVFLASVRGRGSMGAWAFKQSTRLVVRWPPRRPIMLAEKTPVSTNKLDTSSLLTYAYRSQWSIGHLRPLAIALCSGLLLSFQSSWSLVASALLQCLASNCCEAGLSSSFFPCGFQVRAWRVVLDAGFLRVCPI